MCINIFMLAGLTYLFIRGLLSIVDEVTVIEKYYSIKV
jgi:hypothetical protein